MARVLIYKRAMSAISEGDAVYTHYGAEVRKERIVTMDEMGIKTDFDFYGYEDHGVLWWMTETVARKKLREDT